MSNSALQESFFISILQEFFAITGEIFILAGGGGGWALGYHFMEFRRSPNVS